MAKKYPHPSNEMSVGDVFGCFGQWILIILGVIVWGGGCIYIGDMLGFGDGGGGGGDYYDNHRWGD
jgi:hypothetical protein|tara:strand:+ start:322 stop:519 length:198 start_codon:yes stop_codon:yes gene_type:complete